jgi:hypothetical protein
MGAPKAHKEVVDDEATVLSEASKCHGAAVAAVVAALEAKQVAANLNNTNDGGKAKEVTIIPPPKHLGNAGPFSSDKGMLMDTSHGEEDKDKDVSMNISKEHDVEDLEDEDDDMEFMGKQKSRDTTMEEEDDDMTIVEAPVAAPVGNKRDTVKYVEVSFQVSNSVKGGDVVKPLYVGFLGLLKALNITSFFAVVMKFKPAKHADTTKTAPPKGE